MIHWKAYEEVDKILRLPLNEGGKPPRSQDGFTLLCTFHPLHFLDDKMCGALNWVSHSGRTLSLCHRLVIGGCGTGCHAGWLNDLVVNYSCAVISDAFPEVFEFRRTTMFACSATNLDAEVRALRRRALDPETLFRRRGKFSL